jgi:ribosomal protein L11 methyltransferase
MNNTNYLEAQWDVFLSTEESDIFTSFLLNIGFDSFFEDDTCYKAYILASMYVPEELDNIISSISFGEKLLNYKINKCEDKNWNEEWEQNFQTVLIAETVFIKAPFHEENSNAEYKLIIQPQMSFGTGHHETTAGMIEMMLHVDFKGKKVLDMGTGTGILAIFASLLQADNIIAIDNDPICYDNALHNLKLNNTSNVKVLIGDVSSLGNDNYDIIMANINKNILLNDISKYALSIVQNGLLLLSGFYEDDHREIESTCTQSNLFLEKYIQKNGWSIALYKKL